MIKTTSIYLVVFFLLFLITVLADADTGVTCFVDEECLYYYGEDSYCNVDTATCFMFSESLVEQESVVTETVVEELQQELITLTDASYTTGQRLAALEESSLSLQQRLNLLQGKVDQSTLSQQQVQQVQNNFKEELNVIATGLASTQTEIGELEVGLEEERSFTSIITYMVIFVIIIGVMLISVFFVAKKRAQQRVHPEIVQYITSHIQQGKSPQYIKDQLLNSGWSGKEIHWAYKETMKHNYRRYKGKQRAQKTFPSSTPRTDQTKSSPSKFSQNKIIVIAVITILLVLGIVLLLKGVSSGKAIYFQTPGELDLAVRTALENNFDTNKFYPLVPFVNLCVQVQDGDKSVSYALLKTSLEESIMEAVLPCEQDEGYDFAVKFNTWQSFDFVVNKLTCNSFSNINGKQKNVIILPSRYILPGFTLNPGVSPKIYCPALSSCFSNQELKLAGINCGAVVATANPANQFQQVEGIRVRQAPSRFIR